jgi:hypothetical protein
LDDSRAEKPRPWLSAPRSGRDRPETVESYKDADPRLRLSRAQSEALGAITRGDPIATIAVRYRVSPNRIRRWRKSPVFLKAVAAEISHPTSAGFHLQIVLRGVREANRVRRERAETKELEARDERS